MPTTHSNARLEMFCDGVFAIALTLLIIDIKIPANREINNNAEMWQALKDILPSIFVFILSFAIILITWVNHHNALKLAARSTAAFMYANGVLLLSVVFIPFPTALIGEYILTDHAAPAVIIYNIVLMLQSVGWILICSTGLRGKLSTGEKANIEIRKNLKYAFYSMTGYFLLAILSFWFPVPVLIVTVLLWIVWLTVGINIKIEEENN